MVLMSYLNHKIKPINLVKSSKALVEVLITVVPEPFKHHVVQSEQNGTNLYLMKYKLGLVQHVFIIKL